MIVALISNMAPQLSVESDLVRRVQGKLNGSSPAAVNGSSNSLPGKVSSKKRKAATEEETPAAPASKTKKKQKSQESDEIDNGSAAPEGTPEVAQIKRSKKNASQKAPAAVNEDDTEPQEQRRKLRVVHVVVAGEAPSLAAFKATPRSGWWGARRFASAGKAATNPPSVTEAEAVAFLSRQGERRLH